MATTTWRWLHLTYCRHLLTSQVHSTLQHIGTLQRHFTHGCTQLIGLHYPWPHLLGPLPQHVVGMQLHYALGHEHGPPHCSVDDGAAEGGCCLVLAASGLAQGSMQLLLGWTSGSDCRLRGVLRQPLQPSWLRQ